MRNNGGKVRKLNTVKKDAQFFDYSLLFVVLFLVGFGLIMVYSASSYDASTSKSFNYDAAYFLKKQARAALMGGVGMIAMAFIPYRFWERFAIAGYVVSMI